MKFAFLALSVFLFFQIHAQDISAELTGLEYYASDQYGTSDILVNGWKYYPEHFNAEGDPYFNEMRWQTGSVETTEGSFHGLSLRYNIQMDELILNKILKNGETAFVMLNQDFILSFSIGDHHFINAGKQDMHPSLEGYMEVIFSGKLIYIAEHSKMFVANYSENNAFGSISGQNTDYYLLAQGRLHKIYSKRSLYKVFPDEKRQIRQYLRKENIKFRKAGRPELKRLMNYLDTIL